jgi:hypothetical protein
MFGIIIGQAIVLGTSWAVQNIFFGPEKPTPVGPSSVPRTDEGAPIPLIYGRCRVDAPTLAWIGNWAKNPHGATAISYSLDMLFVVGIPFYGGSAELVSIYAGDFHLDLTPKLPDSMTRPGRYHFRSSNALVVYGGDQKGGGINGDVEFFDGRPDQQVSDYIDDFDAENYTVLQTRQTAFKWYTAFDDPANIEETLMPGYRNQAICLLYTWTIGESPNFTSYSFEARALSTGTSAHMGFSLADDACPAAVIYDLLTSPWGKLGFPTDKIDHDSFVAAAATLFTEEHGYSRAITQIEDAATIIGDVLRQIGGLLYEEPTNGKLVLKLIRSDYDVNDLDDINPDVMEEPSPGWFVAGGVSETFNQVRIAFVDRQNNYVDGLAIGQNAANVFSQLSRGLRSVDIQYPGCSNETLAKKLASRDAAAASRPLIKATCVVNRNFYATRPGDVLTLTWPKLGIAGMVMRVGQVNLGQLHDGRITLHLVRDDFDVTLGAF